MKNNRTVIIVAVAVVAAIGVFCLFRACSPNEEEQREPIKRPPNKAEQREAIRRALDYDEGIAEKRKDEAGFWGILLGDDNARRKYVHRLRQIPLESCPGDFKEAYQTHVKAWEDNDQDAIRRTWDKVILTAYEYDVEYED